jgi:protein MpaA
MSLAMRSAYIPRSLNLPKPRPVHYVAETMLEKQNRVFAAVAELQSEAVGSEHLFYSEIGSFRHSGQTYALPRFVFLGPGADDEPVKIGIFAAIHGDEPETAHAAVEFLHRLLKEPERARGYQIFVYPVCNPTGIEDATRHSRNDLDLNREFWTGSKQPEVYYLERELGVLAFQGVVALHADDTTHGVYAFVRGATLTEALARPALEAASKFLPRASGELIDNFPAKDALIHQHCYDGVLCNPAELHPAPFEIIFETPAEAASHLQVEAAIAALDTILEEYRPFLSIQQNL